RRLGEAADDKVCCSSSPDSHEEHIKCSSARAELATDLIVRRPQSGLSVGNAAQHNEQLIQKIAEGYLS
ncbi:hypothetical protein, partial [Collinsella aerofaciens]|uniref:hypothetical protein n=1 Tax=Collinsella aerofaciens TaxID=74426 RepID=UPI0034A50492